MIDVGLKNAIAAWINEPIIAIKPVSGGDINEAASIHTISKKYFVKYNNHTSAYKMLSTEQKGLQLIATTQEIATPQCYRAAKAGAYSFLLMDFYEPQSASPQFWKNFGRALAKMHMHTAPNFGLDHDNFIGSLEQPNKQFETWSEFYILQRLAPQFQLAFNTKRLNATDRKSIENLYKLLPELLPEEAPALIHGDLWNGNFIVGINDQPILIDPAVFYGSREIDLAMSKLFGGFAPSFYESYNQTFPLEKGIEKRVELYQLYYLLVHVNLFGGSYISSVRSILNPF